MFRRSLLALPFVLFSGFAMAVCPPILPCKVTAEASTIAGSNADAELIKFSGNITTSSNQVAQSIIDMANANSAALQQSTQAMVATNAELSQIKLAQDLQVKQALADKAMAHQVELAENQYRMNSSVVAQDDTKEEFELILKHLEQYKDLSVPEIVEILSLSFDKDPINGKIPIPIKVAEGTCSVTDVNEEGWCAIPKHVTPGAKLQALFKQCTIDKRLLITKKSEKKARVTAVQITDEKTSAAMASTNAVGSVNNRISTQRVLSCSPNEFRNKLCATDKTVEQYQEDIVIGNIVPNGNLSASNFSKPSISSAEGYIDDLPDDVREQIRNQSLDRTELQAYPNQKVIPFTYTYRNANQVKAAMDFVDNVIADDLVPALDPNARRQIQNAEYQARHMSRIAALSMARLTLMDSMSQRVGKVMQDMIEAGAFSANQKFEVTAGSPANKESVLGNAPLDLLVSRVEQSYASLQHPAVNGESSNASNDFMTAPSNGDLNDKIIESVTLQNEMLFKEALMNEQLLSMQAIALAQKANSKDMVELMTALRRGR